MEENSDQLVDGKRRVGRLTDGLAILTSAV